MFSPFPSTFPACVHSCDDATLGMTVDCFMLALFSEREETISICSIIQLADARSITLFWVYAIDNCATLSATKLQRETYICKRMNMHVCVCACFQIRMRPISVEQSRGCLWGRLPRPKQWSWVREPQRPRRHSRVVLPLVHSHSGPGDAQPLRRDRHQQHISGTGTHLDQTRVFLHPSSLMYRRRAGNTPICIDFGTWDFEGLVSDPK